MREVATHCPYCALQCGMTLRERADGSVEVAPRDFPTNRGGLCQKGWTAAELLGHPDRLTTPLVRDGKGAPLRPATWDEALDRVATRIRDLQDAHGPDAVAVFGGGGLTNEKAYALGKFARVALRHPAHRLQRPVLHVVGRRGRDPGVRDRPGAAVPARRPRRADVARAGRRQPRRDHAAAGPAPRPSSARAAAGSSSSTRAGPPTARQADPAPAAHARHRPRPRQRRCCTWSSPRATSTAAYVDDAHHRLRRGHAAVAAGYWPERVERLTGVPVADLRDRGAPARPGRPGDHRSPRAAPSSTQGHRHGHRLDQPGAGPGPARAARLRLRLPHRPGQRAGRPRARAEGRPAARLPEDRRPGGARARRGGVGRRPGRRCPVRACPRPSCSTRSARRTARARCSCSAPTRSCRRPGRAPVERRLRRARPARGGRLRPVGDRRAGRRRAAGHPVGRGGRHDDQPGGPGPAPPGAAPAARRRPHRPGDHRRRWPGGSAVPVTSRPTPEEIFAELRRASAGGPADYAGIDLGPDRREDGVFWPCPSRRSSGYAPAVRRPVRHPGRAGPVRPGRAPAGRPRHRTTAYPLLLTTGRVLAQYQSGAQTRRVEPLNRAAPEAFVEVHPDLAATPRHRGRRPGSRRDPPGHGRGAGPGGRHASGRTPLFVPFHWPARARANSAHRGRARPDVADARVQGLRRPAGEGRMTRVVVVGAGMAGVPAGRGAARPRTRPGRHACSAPSRTGRTTGSCCPTCSPGRPGETDVLLVEPAGRGARLRLGRGRGRDRPDRSDGHHQRRRPDRRTTSWCWPPAAGRAAADQGPVPRRRQPPRSGGTRSVPSTTAAGSWRSPATRGQRAGPRRWPARPGGGARPGRPRPRGHRAARGRAPDGPPARPAGRRRAGRDILAGLGVRVELDAATVAVAVAAGRGRRGPGRRPPPPGRPARGRLRRARRAPTWPSAPGSPSSAASWSTTGCARTDPAIFAIGDCAQHAGTVGGLVAPAWEQARVVADVLTGRRPLARYRTARRSPGSRRPASTWPRSATRPAVDGEAPDVRRPGPRHVRQARGPRTTGWPARSCWATTRPSARSSSSSTGAAPLPADRRALLLGRAIGDPVGARPVRGVARADAGRRGGLPVQHGHQGRPAGVLARRRAGRRRTWSPAPGPPPAAAAAATPSRASSPGCEPPRR